MSDQGTSATPYLQDDRDFGQFSDHITVWVDKYIGEEKEYDGLKKKFYDQVQVLQSNNYREHEIDDESMLCTDQRMLNTLGDQVYCLKYFSTPEKGLSYILSNPTKKVFFISSGTIGKLIVPEIYKLSQIQGIYIFCGDISLQVGWAADYIENISAMLEHQDDLLTRLTRDIGVYVEQKGDQHKKNGDILQARNCYSWAKKLYDRGTTLGDGGAHKCIGKINVKLEEVQSSAQAPSGD